MKTFIIALALAVFLLVAVDNVARGPDAEAHGFGGAILAELKQIKTTVMKDLAEFIAFFEQFRIFKQVFDLFRGEFNIFRKEQETNLKKMTAQLVTSKTENTRQIGSFIDAQNLINTKRAIKKEDLQATKRYEPGETYCAIASATKSLTASEIIGKNASAVFQEYSIDRDLNKKGTSSAEGPVGDIEKRVQVFRSKHCDPENMNGALKDFCQGGGGNRVNNDVNTSKMVFGIVSDKDGSSKKTAANVIKQGDQEHIADLKAMGANLYASSVLPNMIKTIIERNPGASEDLLEWRSITASRSAAREMFTYLTNQLNSQGDSMSAESIQAFLKELFGDQGAAALSQTLGDDPSYDKQMEFLTKIMLQSPQFYIKNQTGPEKIARVQLAVNAIRSMQERDQLELDRRRGLIESLILEQLLADRQARLASRIYGQTER